MAARKRIVKKLPDFRLPGNKEEEKEEDLKKVKAQAIKEIAENQKNKNEWLDNEMEKNLKNAK
jgi:hypothetical protein